MYVPNLSFEFSNEIQDYNALNGGISSEGNNGSLSKKVDTLFKMGSGALLATVELLTLGHICDRIKTLQQANPQERSIINTAKKIYSNGGFKGFYKGLEYNVMTVSGKASFRWGTLSVLNETVDALLPKEIVEKYPSLRSGSVAILVSLCESLLLVCPAESLKTKEMTQKTNLNTKGIFNVTKWIKESGYKSMYDGWDSILFRQAVSWFTFLVAYDKTKRLSQKIKGETPLNLVEQFSVGAVAGGINVICTTPIDTIKTQMQKHQSIYKRSTFNAFFDFARTEGVKSLYSGFNIRLFRSTWHSGFTLLMMDKLGVFRTRS